RSVTSSIKLLTIPTRRISYLSAELLKSDLPSIVEKIQQLQDRAKKLEKELQQLKEKSAVQAVSDLAQKAQTINGVKVVIESETRSEEHTSEIQSRFDLVCRHL